MKMVTLLKKIDNEEVKNETLFHGGDLFYKIIVIDKKLFIINENIRELTLIDSKLIGNFITNNYELYEYKKVLND